MVFYQCPDCGYKQKSKAKKRVECHRCGRSYLKRDAEKSEKKTPDSEEETGFFKYKKKD